MNDIARQIEGADAWEREQKLIARAEAAERELAAAQERIRAMQSVLSSIVDNTDDQKLLKSTVAQLRFLLRVSHDIAEKALERTTIPPAIDTPPE